jgi:6-phosphogluconate dehydrogenase
MIEEFEEKVNREIYKFSRSRLMLEMDHVSLVFKGWNKKE